MIASIKFMLAPLQRRVALMVSRAVISLVDDTKKIQIVQANLLANSTRDGVERFQNYGFTSHPHPGAEAVAVSVGGNQDHAIIIVVDDRRFRLINLAEGEVAFSDDLGQKVHLTRNGMVISGAGLPIIIQDTPSVTVDTPQFHITGDLTINGKAAIAGDIDGAANINAGAAILAVGNVSAMQGAISMSNMKTVYNGHTHVDAQGGNVGSANGQI